jgi:hypothetical protein
MGGVVGTYEVKMQVEEFNGFERFGGNAVVAITSRKETGDVDFGFRRRRIGFEAEKSKRMKRLRNRGSRLHRGGRDEEAALRRKRRLLIDDRHLQLDRETSRRRLKAGR